ncbi:MAG TPA: hypothetical protein VHK05_01035 [Candidatus Limnocylindrales bacterium]|jgi:hypothetical protein|nr:hypothetical protein [Candidatus Limnocylindrales bacterium]
MQALQDRHLVDPRPAIAAAGAAVIFAAGIVLGTLIDPDAATLGTVSAVPVGDRSYDAVEETRLRLGSSPTSVDRSYDAVEETRANRGLSVPAGDHSYDAVEETRADRGLE